MTSDKETTFETTLDLYHKKLINNRFLQLFTAFTRVLLAVGFIPPSIPKILYRRFTLLPESTPVGHYFEALYQTGYYYQFIGWSQLLAAILLLIPRTSHLGALMFLPIIVNIAVLTNSVGFNGTWLVTILMLLACTYLVLWDFDRWKLVFFSGTVTRSDKPNWLVTFGLTVAVTAVVAIGFLTIGAMTSEQGLLGLNWFIIAIWILGFWLFSVVVSFHYRYMRMMPAECTRDKKSLESSFN